MRHGVPLPGDRRPALLRARRDQGRDGLPAACSTTRPTRSRCAASSTSRGAASATPASTAWRRPPASRAARSGTRSPTPTAPGLGAAAARSVRAFRALMDELRDRAVELSVGDLLETLLTRTGIIEALEAERTIEASGRIENLQELVGVAREYAARSEEPSLAGFLQEVALTADADALADGGRRRSRHADDAPQRQGPRVRRGLRDRHGAEPLPARARDRGGEHRGGAPPLLRRDHPRAPRAVTRVRPPAHALRRARQQPPVAVPRRDPGERWCERRAQGPAAYGGAHPTRAGGGGWRALERRLATTQLPGHRAARRRTRSSRSATTSARPARRGRRHRHRPPAARSSSASAPTARSAACCWPTRRSSASDPPGSPGPTPLVSSAARGD